MPGMTVNRQVVEFMTTCGLGFLLGAYYECFRTMRIWSKPSVVICVFQDIFFCLSSAVVTFFVLLGLSDGAMYPYLFIGEAVGFFIFYGSLGMVVHRLLVRVLGCLSIQMSRLRQKVFAPFYNRLRKIFSLLCSLLEEKRKKLKKR